MHSWYMYQSPVTINKAPVKALPCVIESRLNKVNNGKGENCLLEWCFVHLNRYTSSSLGRL